MAFDAMQLDLEQLRDCFAEAHRERDQLEESIERSLESIAALQGRLCEWNAELHDGAAELESQRINLARDADEAGQVQAAKIGRLESELAAALEDLSRQTSTDEEVEKLHRQQQEEVRRLREECEKLEIQCNSTQEELQVERRSSQELRAALETAHEGIAKELEDRLKVINDELALTRGHLDERTEAVQSLAQERTALETELEMVRARAAELNDTLDKERKQIAQDRAEWSGELKQLRRLLERQARLAAATAANEAAAPAPLDADGPPAQNGSRTARRSDPVVGSVLAQFDRIRQQRIAARTAN